jgi:hypothetical protein
MADEEKAEEKYHLSYEVNANPDGFTASELEEGKGACDQLIAIAMTRQADGAYLQVIESLDGKSAEALSSQEIFKAWIMMGASIQQLEGLGDVEREFAARIFEGFMQLLKQPKPGEWWMAKDQGLVQIASVFSPGVAYTVQPIDAGPKRSALYDDLTPYEGLLAACCNVPVLDGKRCPACKKVVAD